MDLLAKLTNFIMDGQMDANSESFEDLFKAAETKKIRHLTPGQKIKATIVGINDETSFLDVGGKSEGILKTSFIKNSRDRMVPKRGRISSRNFHWI